MKGKTNMGRLKSLVNPHSLPVTKEKSWVEGTFNDSDLAAQMAFFGVNKLPRPHTKKKIPLLYQKIF